MCVCVFIYLFMCTASGRATEGEGERASLVHNASVNTAGLGGSPGNSVVEVSSESSVNSAPSGGGGTAQDRYGSLEEIAVGGAGESSGAALVVGKGTYDSKPLKKEKNINMEAAVLHAVTDLVRRREGNFRFFFFLHPFFVYFFRKEASKKN